MSLPVNVRSIDVLRDFRAHLRSFGEDAKNALAAVEMEISRMSDWLANDRRLYWQGEIRRRRDELATARNELNRKKTANTLGGDANLAEPRDLVREATQRLEEAEQKLERVRRWVPQLQQAIAEYRGQSRPLADMVDGDLEHSLALLERMIRALEEYAEGRPPTTESVSRLQAEVRTPAPPAAATAAFTGNAPAPAEFNSTALPEPELETEPDATRTPSNNG